MYRSVLPLLALTILVTTSCAVPRQRLVPELGPEQGLVKVDKVPPVSDVLKEVRKQLAVAFRAHELRIAGLAAGPLRTNLTPKEGKLTFTGKTQLVRSGEGNIAAVFPFSGYATSTLTPNYGVSTEATSSQQTKLTMSIRPEELSPLVPTGAEPSGYVARALNTMLREAFEAAKANGESMTSRDIAVELTFQIVKVGKAGLGVSFIPSSPEINSIGGAPLMGNAKKRTGTYTLSIEVPLITPDAGDTKRILTGLMRDGSFYLIERPYTDAGEVEAYRFLNDSLPPAANRLKAAPDGKSRRVPAERERQ